MKSTEASTTQLSKVSFSRNPICDWFDLHDRVFRFLHILDYHFLNLFPVRRIHTVSAVEESWKVENAEEGSIWTRKLNLQNFRREIVAVFIFSMADSYIL